MNIVHATHTRAQQLALNAVRQRYRSAGKSTTGVRYVELRAEANAYLATHPIAKAELDVSTWFVGTKFMINDPKPKPRKQATSVLQMLGSQS